MVWTDVSLEQINGLKVLNKSLGKTVPENHVLVKEEVVAHKTTEIIFLFHLFILQD